MGQASESASVASVDAFVFHKSSRASPQRHQSGGCSRCMSLVRPAQDPPGLLTRGDDGGLVLSLCIVKSISPRPCRYEEPRDAEDAMHELDHYRMNGREIEIEFAQGDRKTSHQMRNKYGAPTGGGGGGGRDRDRGDRGDRRRRSRSRSRERSGRGDRGGDRGERRRRSRSRSKSRSRSRDSRQKRDSRRRSETRSKSPADKATNDKDKEKETHSDGAGSDYVEETAD